MRMLVGAVLIAVAEQAFAHSQLVQFPNHLFASEILLPSSGVLLTLGVVMMTWGALTDFRECPRNSSTIATGNAETGV
jgi:membrane-bound ClpP family serine protease